MQTTVTSKEWIDLLKNERRLLLQQAGFVLVRFLIVWAVLGLIAGLGLFGAWVAVTYLLPPA